VISSGAGAAGLTSPSRRLGLRPENRTSGAPHDDRVGLGYAVAGEPSTCGTQLHL